MNDFFINFYAVLVMTTVSIFIAPAIMLRQEVKKNDFGYFPKIRRWLVLFLLIAFTELVITAWLYQYLFYHLLLGDAGVLFLIITNAVAAEFLMQVMFRSLSLGQRSKWSHRMGELMKRLNICGAFSPTAKLSTKKLLVFEWLMLAMVTFTIYFVSAKNIIASCLLPAMLFVVASNIMLLLSLALITSNYIKENNHETSSFFKSLTHWIFAPAFNLFASAMIYLSLAMSAGERK